VLLDHLTGYYKDVGLWDERWWVGGYELGLAFPPDWVGEFVYEPDMADPAATFQPGGVVNFQAASTYPSTRAWRC
jgi:Xaa-Pro dipeptidase